MRFEFTLHYRGLLRSNGSRQHKHELRKHFHKQLRNYLNQTSRRVQLEAFGDQLLVERGGFTFLPLISDEISMAAQIDLFLLKPGPMGSIVTQGGDIDNRLKTLLDSLKVPEENAIPDNVEPDEDENPFYCVLRDDSLITRLSITTDQLLEETSDSSEAILNITVIGRETESFIIVNR